MHSGYSISEKIYTCCSDSAIDGGLLLRYLSYETRIDGNTPEDNALVGEQVRSIEEHVKDGCESCRNEIRKMVRMDIELYRLLESCDLDYDPSNMRFNAVMTYVFSPIIRKSGCPGMEEMLEAEQGLINDEGRVAELLRHKDNCGECGDAYQMFIEMVYDDIQRFGKLGEEETI